MRRGVLFFDQGGDYCRRKYLRGSKLWGEKEVQLLAWCSQTGIRKELFTFKLVDRIWNAHSCVDRLISRTSNNDIQRNSMFWVGFGTLNPDII